MHQYARMGRRQPERRPFEWCCFVFTGATLCCSVSTVAQPTDPLPQEETVIIWRRVRNDFHNSAIPDTVIDGIVQAAPTANLTIPSGGSLSEQLQKNFRISQSFTPAIYKSVISRISLLNGLANPNAIAAGTKLQVPVIPETGRKYFRAAPTIGQNVRLSLTWNGGVAGSAVTAVAPQDVDPQYELQYIAVPKSRVDDYIIAGNPDQGKTGGLPVKLAQGAAASMANRTLSPQAVERIKARLGDTSPASPRPLLLIVDDAIPDNAEYQRTKHFVLEMSRTLRERLLLGPPSRYYNALANLPATLPAADSDSLYPHLKRHASVIKHSLGEFTAIDNQTHVEVLYLPLAATQLGVGAILQEVTYLAELLKMTNPMPGQLVSADIGLREKAEGVVDAAVVRNKSVFVYGPVPLANGQELAMMTDQALLEAYAITLAFYSDTVQRPHAFSFSWTMPLYKYPVNFVDAAYGWKFAAAGNKGDAPATPNFMEEGLQFAARAGTTKDVIAVLNSSSTNGNCASNIFNDDGLEVLGIAFAGDVDSQFCGTSFSTPRVAWLVAAREAATGKKLPSFAKHTKLVWLQQQQKFLLGLKNSAVPGLMQRYGLDAKTFFDK